MLSWLILGVNERRVVEGGLADLAIFELILVLGWTSNLVLVPFLGSEIWIFTSVACGRMRTF